MTITVTPIKKSYLLEVYGAECKTAFSEAKSRFVCNWKEGENQASLWATCGFNQQVGYFTADEVEQIAEQLYQFAKHMRGEA